MNRTSAAGGALTLERALPRPPPVRGRNSAVSVRQAFLIRTWADIADHSIGSGHATIAEVEICLKQLDNLNYIQREDYSEQSDLPEQQNTR